jgi:hypothetical protein
MGFLSDMFNPAGAVKKASAKANAEISKTRDANTALYSPYVQGGGRGFGTLQDLYGLNGVDAQANAGNMFTTSPGYQFSVDQGINALDRSSSAKGLNRSGAQMKALSEYGTGMAAQEYQKWLAGISDIAKFGLAGASGNVASNNLAAQAIAGNYMKVGEAQANQGIGYLNNLTGGIGSIMGLGTGGGGTVGGSLLTSAAGFFSDENEKTDITRLGKDPETGEMLYAYRYKDDPKTYPKVVGPMAQDIEKKNPKAVRKVGGKRIVDLAGLR